MKKNSKNEIWNEKELKKSESNICTVHGCVKRLIYESRNCCKYCVEIAKKTEKGNVARSWLTVVAFEDYELEEGIFYDFNLQIVTNSYNDKFSTEFVIIEVE